jgi:hypothetical protein
MCIAVGKVSFDDCERLTSSLGWMGVLLPSSPPDNSMARLAMTSLTFMFDWVPDPVCHTTSGKCSSSAPLRISSHTRAMASALSRGKSVISALVSAAAFLSTAKARMTSIGMRSPPMRKFSSERCVCAPQ